MRAFLKAVALSGLLATVGACAVGCGCKGPVIPGLQKAEPRDKFETALLLLYMDDSASVDEHRKEYGEWAISLLRAMKPEDPTKLGVHFCTFRSKVTDKADLKMTGRSSIESSIIAYEDAHPAPDSEDPTSRPDHRDKGTSLKELLKDAQAELAAAKASSVMIAIFTDGGFEDGEHGDWKGALVEAKKLEKPPSPVKDLKVLVLGVAEDDNNGDLIREQKDFWSKVKIDAEIGKKADTDAYIAKNGPQFGAAAR